MDPGMDLLPPPDGFAYRVDAAGRVVVNRTTGLPKLVPIESSSVGPFPAMDINMTAPPGEMVGATVPLLPRISTTPKSVARSESTRSETKPRRFGARKKKTELLNFVPEAARQIKNSTKQTFESVTDFAIGDGPGDAAQDALRGMSTFVQDFFKFLARGNVLDLAVGIIVGNAFTAIVTSLTNDMISPILGLMGSKDLAAYNTVMRAGLSGNSSYPTPAQAKADAAITLAWGSFLNSIVNFLIISFAVFNMIKVIGLFYRKKQAVMTTCFWCKEAIIDGARRCGKCGSEIPTKEQKLIIDELEKQGHDVEGMADYTSVGVSSPVTLSSPLPSARNERFA